MPTHPEKVQTVNIRDFSGVGLTLEISEQNHTPSWKRFDLGGHAMMEVTHHSKKDVKWVSFMIREVAGMTKSMKETYMTLDEKPAEELYKFLHAKFGKRTPEASRLKEAAKQILARLDHHGSIDSIREEGAIQDLRDALAGKK